MNHFFLLEQVTEFLSNTFATKVWLSSLFRFSIGAWHIYRSIEQVLQCRIISFRTVPFSFLRETKPHHVVTTEFIKQCHDIFNFPFDIHYPGLTTLLYICSIGLISEICTFLVWTTHGTRIPISIHMIWSFIFTTRMFDVDAQSIIRLHCPGLVCMFKFFIFSANAASPCNVLTSASCRPSGV